MAKQVAWTLTVQFANTQAILWVFVETLSALEASFSALDGLAGGAAAEAWAFSLEGPSLETKVSRDSKRSGMSGSFLLVLVIGGGERGTMLGVGRGETRYLFIPAVDPIVKVDTLTFWFFWASSCTSAEGKDPEANGLRSANRCSICSLGTFSGGFVVSWTF